jgi:ketosteroid isomerase-like protein
MSQKDDLETLRRIYAQWARGEFWDLAAFDPEVEFVLAPSLPEPGIYRGYEGMGKGFREGWLESWSDLRFEAEEVVVASEARIVVLYRQTAIGKSSGVKTEARGGHVWTMRDGRVVRLEVHANRDAALEAAGLRE